MRRACTFAALLAASVVCPSAFATNVAVARQTLEGFGVDVLSAEIPLLAAFEKAEVEGVCVSEAVDDRGRADLRRMGGWSGYCSAAVQIRERLMAKDDPQTLIA